MNANNKSKGFHTLGPTHWAMNGESCSFIQNNYEEPNDLLEW